MPHPATAVRRPYNFAAGPATLPLPVLEQAASEMTDWHGSGMGVMEMSHRGSEFMAIYTEAERDLRDLLAVPENFKILFMQGGGIGENAIVPLNVSRAGRADFIVSGSWSKKSSKEAAKYCDAAVAASSEDNGGFRTIPPVAGWQLRDGTEYVHICGNETIHGVEYQTLPDLKALGHDVPLVVDCSSHILSRPMDWSRIGVAFAGAQKNVGMSGVTLVFVREDLIGRALPICPSAFDYKLVADADSMFNTPPTYAIYIAGLVFKWVKAQGGVAEMERRAVERSSLLYRYIDGSGFYRNEVDPAVRSRMNVPFFLPNDALNAPFLEGAKAAGLLQLKGHKSVGGMRASIYNAMPVDGVRVLLEYLQAFARQHG